MAIGPARCKSSRSILMEVAVENRIEEVIKVESEKEIEIINNFKRRNYVNASMAVQAVLSDHCLLNIEAIGVLEYVKSTITDQTDC